MSEGKRWPIEEARNVAAVIGVLLQGTFERIEVVGSVRRGKPDVGDVELLFVPRMESRQVDMFTSEPFDLASERIDQLVADGRLQQRLNKEGHRAGWGPNNKLAVFTDNGMPVDLFSTTAEKWWVSLVIRTGGKDTNLELTMGANKLNRTLNAYGSGVTDRSTGIITPAVSEAHVFELCGVPYREPKDRQ